MGQKTSFYKIGFYVLLALCVLMSVCVLLLPNWDKIEYAFDMKHITMDEAIIETQKTKVEYYMEESIKDGGASFNSGEVFEILKETARIYLLENENVSFFDSSCFAQFYGENDYGFGGYTKDLQEFAVEMYFTDNEAAIVRYAYVADSGIFY